MDLDGCGADLAVGCTYKYLNAGPGAPAFLYVRRDLQDQLTQPIQGWFSQQDQFSMGPRYEPVPGITRFTTGTPNIPGTAAVQEGTRLLAEAGIQALRDKGIRLTSYLIELADAWLAPLGCTLASPRDAARRGSHVCLRHPEAGQISAALTRAGVIGDFRAPDRLRLGPAPITTRFTDVWDALDTLRTILETKAYADIPAAPAEPPDPQAAGASRSGQARAHRRRCRTSPGPLGPGGVSGHPARALRKEFREPTGGYSHSMVPGGLLVMSSTTRLTSGTSLVIRVEIRASRSPGSRAQSAVMASSLVTGRSTTG